MMICTLSLQPYTLYNITNMIDPSSYTIKHGIQPLPIDNNNIWTDTTIIHIMYYNVGNLIHTSSYTINHTIQPSLKENTEIHTITIYLM